MSFDWANPTEVIGQDVHYEGVAWALITLESSVPDGEADLLRPRIQKVKKMRY